MESPSTLAGIALLCDREGRIRRLIQDDFGLSGILIPGRLFTTLVARSQLPSALDFLVAAGSQDPIYDWALALSTPEEELTLYFSAQSWGADILITGVGSARHTHRFILQIMQDIGEPKPIPGDGQVSFPSTPTIRYSDHTILDELSRLNNELTNLQRSLAKKNAELAELNELKNQFFGMAAHDLRGSLWVIQLYCQILLRETESLLNKEQKEFLETIRTTAESMSNIVSDYLDISALESGRVALRRKTEDLIALARQSFKLNLVSAEDKHLKVKLDLDAAALPVSLDAGKILQVMNNLISNAIKYSPPNACIEIHVRHPGPEKVVFSVQDQGPGIPSDKRESIFEPFQREDSGGETREKSWGLGLAIVKRIVEAHGGIVSVEGREGSGAIFSVSLPMDPEKPLKTG